MTPQGIEAFGQDPKGLDGEATKARSAQADAPTPSNPTAIQQARHRLAAEYDRATFPTKSEMAALLRSGAHLNEQGIHAASVRALTTALTEAEELRKALEFYRDSWAQDVDAELTASGWVSVGPIGDVEPSTELLADKGERARQALNGGSK